MDGTAHGGRLDGHRDKWQLFFDDFMGKGKFLLHIPVVVMPVQFLQNHFLKNWFKIREKEEKVT